MTVSPRLNFNADPRCLAWGRSRLEDRGLDHTAFEGVPAARTATSVTISSAQWQATWWPPSTVRSSGTSSWQRVGRTNGQRVWKAQPGGGAAGDGRSPA